MNWDIDGQGAVALATAPLFNSYSSKKLNFGAA